MVDILMATFNGGKYIENQLLSLIAQTHKDWVLYVHDDGSTDNTIEIIKKYQERDKRIYLIEDNVIFGSAGQNFMYLLTFAKSDFIAFCDQDDIWFEMKLEKQLAKIEKEKSPCLVYSNGYTFDGNKIIAKNFITFHRTNLKDSLFLNGGLHGCCIMFNRKLVDIINNKLPDYVYMHDHFFTILAVTFGKIVYIESPYMLYRQHENNVTGNIETSIFKKMKTFLNIDNPILELKHYQSINAFYNRFKDEMSYENKRLFKAYLKFPEIGKIKRLYMVVYYSFKIKKILFLLIKVLIRKAL